MPVQKDDHEGEPASRNAASASLTPKDRNNDTTMTDSTNAEKTRIDVIAEPNLNSQDGNRVTDDLAADTITTTEESKNNPDTQKNIKNSFMVTDPTLTIENTQTQQPVSIDDLGDAFPAAQTTIPISRHDPSTDSEVLGDAFPEDNENTIFDGTEELMAAVNSSNPVNPTTKEIEDTNEHHAVEDDAAALAKVIAQSVDASAITGNAGIIQTTSSAMLPSAIDQAWAEIDSRQDSWRSLMNDSHDRHNTGKIARTLAEQPRYAIATNNEAARIVCVGGADLGAEFTLSTDDIIGRSSSCSIIFNETSVSRQHAQIYREGNLYYLIDKNSANGTFVNHQRISKQILQNGDEINFGNAMFRFIAPGEIYKRDPLLKNDIPAANVIVKESTRDRSAFTTASSAESSVLSYVLISVVILLIAAVIALGIIYLRRQDLPTPRATAANYFASGVTAMQKRQWEKAQSQFNIFLTLEPANQAGQRYLKKIEREKSFERQLLAARSALAGGELLLAYNQASSILDSAYTTEAKILLNKINKQLNSNIDEAKNAINAGKYNDAIKLLTIVDAIRPGHAEVTNLLERARTGGHKRSTSTKSVSTQTSLLDDAVKYFNSGNYDTAIAKAKASSSKRSAAMVANIEKFKLIIADAKIEYVAKRADTAIREYELAKSLAKKIGSPANSSVRQNINKNLADMYYVRGIDRWLAQDYNDALTNFRSALANDNSHTPTRNKIDEMRKHAGDFYNEAEKIYNSNPKRAKSLYRLVMQLLPASDDRYRQSARRIDANP